MTMLAAKNTILHLHLLTSCDYGVIVYTYLSFNSESKIPLVRREPFALGSWLIEAYTRIYINNIFILKMLDKLCQASSITCLSILLQ